MRKVFANHLRNNYLHDDKNTILLGDISVGLFLNEKDELVDNAYNMGILEQSMISFAAGLSSEMSNVFVHTISPFIIERAYEQIKLDLSYNCNKVILVSANGPFEYKKLGPTHHCSADVPILNLLSNIDIYLPARDQEVISSIDRISDEKNSAYLRLNNQSANDLEINPNDIIHKTSKLNIFVGEALNELRNNNNESCLYIYALKDFNDIDLSLYDEITVYEPYSLPILGPKIKLKNPDKKIIFKYYPKSIESGIYNLVEFIEES